MLEVSETWVHPKSSIKKDIPLLTSHFGVPPFWKPPRMTGQWGRLPDRPHRPVLFLVPVAVTVRMPAPRRVAGHPPMGSIIGYPENDMEIEKTTDIVK